MFGGVVFGAGLVISGMTEPGNVIGFLRLDANWNVALILVMGSALVVTFAGYRLLGGSTPWFAEQFNLPGNRQIDKRLVFGAMTFGVGWGIAGGCPGPVLVSSTFAGPGPLIFIFAMLSGLAFASWVIRHQGSQTPHPAIVRIPVTVQS